MDSREHSEGAAPHGHEAFRCPWVMGPRLDYRPMMPVTDPENRIAFGAVILMVAWAVLYVVDDLGNGRHWFAGMAAFAVGMIVSGVNHIRHDRRVRRDLDRARREWRELRVGAAAAEGDGEGIPRFLVRRGYREYFVRRWIADRLAGELERAADEPPA